MAVGRAEGFGPDPQGVAHEKIVKALMEVPEVNLWDDVFVMAADVAISTLLAMPVEERMGAMGMTPVARLLDKPLGVSVEWIDGWTYDTAPVDDGSVFYVEPVDVD